MKCTGMSSLWVARDGMVQIGPLLLDPLIRRGDSSPSITSITRSISTRSGWTSRTQAMAA
jgi:hypothetical protein